MARFGSLRFAVGLGTLLGCTLLAVRASAGPASTTPPPPSTPPGSEAPPAATAQPAASAAPPPPATTAAPQPPRGQALPPAPLPAAPRDPTTEAQPTEPVDLSNTWNFSRTAAAPPRYVRPTESAVVYVPNPVGFYSGVSVAGNQVPPRAPAALGGKPALITWTGFERTDTGSRVFFQLSASTTYRIDNRGNRIVLRIVNSRPNARNNQRRLDLRYFKTPVQEVTLRRAGRDTIATMSLRHEATARVQELDATSSASGYRLLVVDFDDAPTPTPPE